jgi:hypothetical protein
MCIISAQNTQNPEVVKAFLFVRIKRMWRKVADITSCWMEQGKGPESCTTTGLKVQDGLLYLIVDSTFSYSQPESQ